MKKKTVKMVLAVAALAVACVAYFGVKTYVTKQEAQEETEEETVTNVFTASTDDIKSLKFMIDKKEVAFDKEEDTWVKQDETAFPVSQDKLNEAADGVSSIDADRVLEDVDDLAEYGLNEPLNTITITTNDDKETSIRVGMKNDSTSQYYISKDEDKNVVYVIADASIEPFMSTLYDYAEKEAFPVIDASTVKRVEVNGEDSSYALEEDSETGLWSISDTEGKEKADSAKASSMTTFLSSLAYDSFINYNNTDNSIYGFDNPYAVITIDYEESEEETDDENSDEDTEEEAQKPEIVKKQLILTIGDEAEDGGRYVKVDDSKQVYTMSEDSLSAFIGKEKADFWDLTVSYISVNDLEHLQVEFNNETHTFDVSRETSEDEDGEEQETIKYLLDEKKIDSTNFTTFYNKMINMAGQKRLAEEFKPEQKPEMTVKFEKTDDESITVEYYNYDTNFYSVVVDEKVYLVNKMTVKDMISSYENLIGENTNDIEMEEEENNSKTDISEDERSKEESKEDLDEISELDLEKDTENQ